VYDLTYERGLVPSGIRARAALLQRRACAEAADGFVFISGTTRDEFRACYPRKAETASVVAWLGRDPELDVAPSELVSPHDRPYLIHVGHRAGYKNFENALAGYATSTLPANGVDLICVGPEFSPDEHAAIAALGMEKHVSWRAAPTRQTLGTWLRSSVALVYVSTCEGFGLPLVEAMQCQTAIIAADASCLPEVGGDVPLYVDPLDPASIADAMERVLDPAVRQSSVEAGARRAGEFTWERCGQRHIELYRRLGIDH
jgi:glycosyltransferase involved in cell wall biosynthesis